ncbi:TPA: ImmA/IrrE family metallo-endopeptidase [Proteus mirabilis]
MAVYYFEDVFRRAITDLESFYKKKYNFNIKVRYSDNLRQHASIVGRNDNSMIRFSKDCCNQRIENSTDLFVALLIVCHELAHYLNHHNYYQSSDDENNRIIEAWADNFGSKLFMVLITYGNEIKRLCDIFSIPNDSGERINLIGFAFKKLCNMFYNNESSKYHYRMERMMHICAGISSFLQFYFGKLQLDLTVDIYLRLYKCSGMYDIIDSDYSEYPISKDDFDRIIEIHYPLQNGNSAITLGLKEEYRKYIDTAFVNDISIAKDYRKAFYLTALAQVETEKHPEGLKEFLNDKLAELE